MKFNDNCVFKLYDLKHNSSFYDKNTCDVKEVYNLPDDIGFEEDGKWIYIYDIEEGITTLLELLYDKAYKELSAFRNDYWSVDIDFTDNSYDFKNAKDALEIFRNKNISDFKSASIYNSSNGSYKFTDFKISHDEGIVKKIERRGFNY